MKKKEEIEKQIIQVLNKMSKNKSQKVLKENNTHNLSLKEHQVFIIGWKLCVLHNIKVSMPKEIGSITVGNMRDHFYGIIEDKR